MKDLGIGSWPERWARVAPDRVAYHFGETRCTWATLADRVRRLAHGLRDLGVSKGDRVSWVGGNHPAFLEAMFACAKIGAVLSPVNPMRAPSEITAALTDAEPRVVLLGRPRPDVQMPPGSPVVVVVRGGAAGVPDYEALIAGAKDGPLEASIALEDLCMLPFTSGTTGPSKGVKLTHGNMTWNALNLMASVDFRAGDVTIAIAPFFRTGGFGVNVTPVLLEGGTVVIAESVDADEILRLCERHRVTVGFGNPHLLDALLASPFWPTADLSSLRFLLTGGAPVPLRLLKAFSDRGIPLVQGYGLSEFSPVALVLDAASAADRSGSAGKPLHFVEARVVRPDGSDCAPGEAGELLVSGPSVMAGYWRREEATARAVDAGGWLHTGDAARVDAAGFYWIVDRYDAGFDTAEGRVFPGDVERVLEEHEAVVEVGVVGVPDGPFEAPVAFVVLREGGDVSAGALLDLCRRRLRPVEVPRSVTFVDVLPRSTVGKLLRHELRARAVQAS